MASPPWCFVPHRGLKPFVTTGPCTGIRTFCVSEMPCDIMLASRLARAASTVCPKALLMLCAALLMSPKFRCRPPSVLKRGCIVV